MELKESYRFLNRLRDIYRLSVAPLNRLDPSQFGRPAELLGYRDGVGERAGAKLLEDFRKHTSRVATSLEKLLESLSKT